MTQDEKQILDHWTDQNLVEYYRMVVKCYPGKRMENNIIIERLVQRGLATGAGDNSSLTDTGKAILAAMETEALNNQPRLQAELESLRNDVAYWHQHTTGTGPFHNRVGGRTA